MKNEAETGNENGNEYENGSDIGNLHVKENGIVNDNEQEYEHEVETKK